MLIEAKNEIRSVALWMKPAPRFELLTKPT